MIAAADIAMLVAAARGARARAHAPYSRFTVGAAILAADGSVVTGANFENASLGLSLCAETVAIAAANAAGSLAGARAIAVVGDNIGSPDGSVVTPCGRCRQLLVEAEHIAGGALLIYCAPAGDDAGESVRRFTVAELLPHAFGPDRLPSKPESE